MAEATLGGLTMRSGSVGSDAELAALLKPDAAVVEIPPVAEPVKTPEPVKQPDPEKPDTADGEPAAHQRQVDPDTGETLDLRTRRGRRIAELVKQRNTTRDENLTLKGELDALRATRQPDPKPAAVTTAPTGPAKPTPDQFSTYEDFVEALADYKAEQKFAAREAVSRATQAEAQQTEAFTRLSDRERAAKAAHADYDDVIDRASEVPISAPIRDVILYHAQGPELRYYLAQHPAETARIRDLPPGEALFEMGLLMSRLLPSSKPEDPPKAVVPPPAPRSAAPPPPKPVGSGSPAADTPDEKLSVRELAAKIRQEEISARRIRAGVA